MELVIQATIQISTVSQIRDYLTMHNFLSKRYSSVVNKPYYIAAYYSILKEVQCKILSEKYTQFHHQN
jgi:hypothetical protein